MGEWLGYVKNLVPFCGCHVDIIIIQIERVGEEKDNEFWVIRSETGECKLSQDWEWVFPREKYVSLLIDFISIFSKRFVISSELLWGNIVMVSEVLSAIPNNRTDVKVSRVSPQLVTYIQTLSDNVVALNHYAIFLVHTPFWRS